MSDQTDKPKLGTRPPLGIKRTVETGKVKQASAMAARTPWWSRSRSAASLDARAKRPVPRLNPRP
jgi:hypothetical protein